MSKIRLTPNASGTGTVTLTVPSTSTDRTVTLPDETGTVITTESNTAPKIPIVQLSIDSGYQSSSSSFTSKLITWDESNARHYDPDNIFDSTNNRIVPTIAGYYWASLMTSHATTDRTAPSITGNGTSNFAIVPQQWDDGVVANYRADTMTGIFYCNGTPSDYIEFYSRCDNTNRSVINTYAQCYLLRGA